MTRDCHRLHALISKADLAALDEMRRREPDLPDRSEMLRRLIRKAAVQRREMAAAE